MSEPTREETIGFAEHALGVLREQIADATALGDAELVQALTLRGRRLLRLIGELREEAARG